MPAYVTRPQMYQVATLYKGGEIALVTPADTGVLNSLQCAIGPEPGTSSTTVMISNTTNQPAQAMWTANEVFYGNPAVPPTYVAVGGASVPSNSLYQVQLSGGWLSFTFASAPTSGSLTVSC